MIQQPCGHYPKCCCHLQALKILYLKQQSYKLKESQILSIKLPKSDVIQFITEDGSRVSIRPSGTEPKIKFYFGVKSGMKYPAEYELMKSKLDDKIAKIVEDLGVKK